MYFVMHSTCYSQYICAVQTRYYLNFTAMKNVHNTIALFVSLFLLTALVGHAEDKEAKKPTSFGTGFYTTKAGKISIMVDKLGSNKPTKIALLNDHGKVIYDEIVNRKVKKFGRVLNIDALQPGIYEIEVTSNGEKQTQYFQLNEITKQRLVHLKD